MRLLNISTGRLLPAGPYSFVRDVFAARSVRCQLISDDGGIPGEVLGLKETSLVELYGRGDWISGYISHLY